jgi:4-amino-4-deoxy-L-arabinose transferase-like glycosyltransferase
MSRSAKLFVLLGLFFLAGLPFAATYTQFYPDERHYFDGGLRMLEHHGWLIPQYPDGSPRFEKPPLTYWVVAVSERFLGVSILAVRLPFLLAGCATLWVTYQLARRLTGCETRSRLAVVILLSQPQFFLSATRAMPDALQTLFLTLGAAGFLRLTVLAETTPAAFWLAYGGAAGATLGKGLLGPGLVLFAWLFHLARAREPGALSKIIYWPGLVVSTVLTASWFVYIALVQGSHSVKTFYVDQVTGNLHGHWWDSGVHLGLYALALGLNFMPWSLPALENLFRSPAHPAARVLAAARNFILAWTVLVVVIFSFAENFSLRYLLPATPLLGILLADWLVGTASFPALFSLRRLFLLMLGVLTLLTAVCWFVAAQWPWSQLFPALLFVPVLAALALLAWLTLHRRALALSTALGLTFLGAWPILFAAVLPLQLPESTHQIAAALRQSPVAADKSVLLLHDFQLASRLRTVLGPDWTVTEVETFDPALTSKYRCILAAAGQFAPPPGPAWRSALAANVYRPPPGSELWAALTSGRLPAVLAADGKNMILYTRQ